MNWFLIALIGPVLYAIANHTDKYLISKYLKNGEVGALLIFSSIFSIVVLPFIGFIYPNVFAVSIYTGLILVINGILIIFATLLYFYAMHKDEASIVVAFYQTIPIFGLILGYFLLGEETTLIKIVASMIIILGASILSFDISLEKIRFKKEVVFLMLGASLFYAINAVVFKLVAIDEGFWPSIFWGLVGKTIIGIFFLLFITSYRQQFFSLIQENKFSVTGINFFNETIAIVAEGVSQYASLLAPVFLVLLVNSAQPFFVLVIGIILTIFSPAIGKEAIGKKELMQKILGIGIMVVGTYIINL